MLSLTFLLQLFFKERHFLILEMIANTDIVMTDDITTEIIRMRTFSNYTKDSTLLLWLESRLSKSLDLLNCEIVGSVMLKTLFSRSV